MMNQKTFIEVPAYADNPAEYERALRHNAANLTKPQLIKLAVGLAIESEQNRMAMQEAGIDAHEDALTIKYLDKFKLRQKGQHLDGGKKTKAKKEAHKKHIESEVVEHLAWTDSHICKYLEKNGLDTHEGRAVKPRQLLSYIAEIRGEHTHIKPVV